jgi:hypothetical protein
MFDIKEPISKKPTKFTSPIKYGSRKHEKNQLFQKSKKAKTGTMDSQNFDSKIGS